MDAGIAAAVALLAAWAAATWWLEPPGGIHLLLSAGVFALVWRVVDRGTRRPPRG